VDKDNGFGQWVLKKLFRNTTKILDFHNHSRFQPLAQKKVAHIGEMRSPQCAPIPKKISRIVTTYFIPSHFWEPLVYLRKGVHLELDYL
jgi:hypothetical protein